MLQRCAEASVSVGGSKLAEIDLGLVILLGVAEGDEVEDADRLAAKCARLRIFAGDDGRMDRSLLDLGTGAAALCVSQFTLYGDTRKGLRPNFTAAAAPELAEPLFERFCEALAEQGADVRRGRFGAMMEVALINDGPVTLLLET